MMIDYILNIILQFACIQVMTLKHSHCDSHFTQEELRPIKGVMCPRSELGF